MIIYKLYNIKVDYAKTVFGVRGRNNSVYRIQNTPSEGALQILSFHSNIIF